MTKNTFISRLLSFLSPRPCPICGLRIETGPSVICASCDMRLPRTGYAADPYENQMAKLYWGRIPIEKAAAFMFYHAGDDACNIIYDMKYHDHPDFCFAMGKLMAKEFGAVGFFDDIDIIMPIPLAASRQRYRGYNQSHEMAKGLSDVTGLPITTKAVKRTKFEGSQTKLGRLERLENMDGIWKLSNAEEVSGKHVLIVDDIVTTAATSISCAKELLKAGNVKISMLSLAYVRHLCYKGACAVCAMIMQSFAQTKRRMFVNIRLLLL